MYRSTHRYSKRSNDIFWPSTLNEKPEFNQAKLLTIKNDQIYAKVNPDWASNPSTAISKGICNIALAANK